MSALEIAITKLLAVSAVTAIVAQRVFPSEAPEKAAKPYILVDLVTEPDIVLLAGGAAEYPESRISISCIGATAAAANSLGEVVKTALQSVTKATIAGAINVDIRKAATDMTDKSDDRKSFRRLMDWYIRWRA